MPESRPFVDALVRARAGDVQCRKVRLRVTGCKHDDEFLACVAASRDAFVRIMLSPGEAAWLAGAGRRLMCKLLERAQHPSERFAAAFDAIVQFMGSELAANGGASILAELAGRKVAALSFYDIVLDFTFLDALDDLEVSSVCVCVCDV